MERKSLNLRREARARSEKPCLRFGVFAQSTHDRTAAGSGAFQGGSSSSSSFADFDLAYDAITSYEQGSKGGMYTVQAGDTLSGIAAALWGDASLWYKIAEVFVDKRLQLKPLSGPDADFSIGNRVALSMAKTVRDHFDALHFSECLLGASRTSNAALEVDVKGVFPLNGYPSLLASPPYSGTLIFGGVMKSKRRLIRYIGNSKRPEGFREPYEEQQEFAPMDEAAAIEFGLEGVQENPEAWVDWTIWARSFEFVVDDESKAVNEEGPRRAR